MSPSRTSLSSGSPRPAPSVPERREAARRIGCRGVVVALAAALLLLAQGASAALFSQAGDVLREDAPYADLRPGAREHDGLARVRLERERHRLGATVSVDVSRPGRVESADDLSLGAITTGRFVDSWLVHADPVGAPLPGAERTFEGSLRFDREILGVILSDALLTAGQVELGAPGTVYPTTGHGAELDGTDRIAIDADGRTLHFRMVTGDDVDQLRVITVATPRSDQLAAFSQLHSARAATTSAPSNEAFRIDNGYLEGDHDPIVLITNTMDAFPLGGFPIRHPDGLLRTSPLLDFYGPYYTRYDAAAGDWRIVNPYAYYPDVLSHHVLIERPGGGAFRHVTTAANTLSNSSYLDHPDANGNPQARVFVTPHHAGPTAPTTAHPHHVGVFWDAFAGRWAVYNEDRAPMALGMQFDVKVSTDDEASFTLSATHYSSGDWGHALIRHPRLDGNPEATPILSHRFADASGRSSYYDHGITIIYGWAAGYWTVLFERPESGEPVHFNVYVPPTASHARRDEATSLTRSGHQQRVDDPLLDGVEDAIVLFTPSLAHGATPNPNPIGIWRNGPGWWLFNENRASWPEGAATNLLRVASGRRAFVHVAGPRFDSGNVTRLDHHLTKEQPEALVFASRNWNPNGGFGPYVESEIGVWYDPSAEDWAVFLQDYGESMPAGAGFNVWVAPADSGAFRHVAGAGNTGEDRTWIDHPLLNENPSADPIVTQVFGSPGFVYNDHPIAVDYDASRGRWEIVNQDGAVMPVGARFHVMPVPEPGLCGALVAGGALLAGLARRRAHRARRADRAA